MASTIQLTPRDLNIFAALDRCPLTALQLLRMSETFILPFRSERKVRARLQRLEAAGRVCRWPLLAIAGRGVPSAYSLTRLGYQLLHGPKTPPPRRRHFTPVRLGHQQHSHALAEFTVHTIIAAHRAGVELADFQAENQLRLHIGSDCLYPDTSFQLVTADGQAWHFFVEIDLGTEPIRSPKDRDSWERKIRLYEAYADQAETRFRVLVIPRKSRERLTHILDLAAASARYANRCTFYGVLLDSYLGDPEPLTGPCFLDHCGRSVGLLPGGPAAARDSSSEGRFPAAVPVCYAPAPAVAVLP